MKKEIITIDQNRCNGCGACAAACHMGAIALVEGKATLLYEDYCDGLGRCLPICPTGAISFSKQESNAGSNSAMKQSTATPSSTQITPRTNDDASPVFTCPGSRTQILSQEQSSSQTQNTAQPENQALSQATVNNTASQLQQWPVQIKLVPITAPYFQGADLLIAADCAAYAYGNFHNEYMKNKVTIIGCPKLDEGDYTEKLTAIVSQNDIASVMVARMEVPCCTGIASATVTAVQNSGKAIPCQIVTISLDGKII